MKNSNASAEYKVAYEELMERHEDFVQKIYDRQQRENEEKLDDYLIIMRDGTIHEEITDLRDFLAGMGGDSEVLSIKHRYLTPFKEVTLTKESND